MLNLLSERTGLLVSHSPATDATRLDTYLHTEGNRTGATIATLLDEACLTDLRTAAAGAVAAKYLAPRSVEAIGIIGAGVQAHLQLELLRHVTSCRRALVRARNPQQARDYRVHGFQIDMAGSVADLAHRCNLIVTATASRTALLQANDVRP